MMLRMYALLQAGLLSLTIAHAGAAQPGSDRPQDATAAQPALLQLETVVVEGQADREQQENITSRALKAHKVVDLAEILSDELCEVQMIRKSGYGNEISMRGFGQENLRILLDDGLLEGACGSRKDPALSHINMLTVEKLDVRQGPFDVTRPGGLGGHVNVITRKPRQGLAGELLGKFGSYGFKSSGVVTTGGSELVQGLVGYNYSESDPYRYGNGNHFTAARTGRPASYTAQGRNALAFTKHDVWGKLQLTPNDQHTFLFEHTYGEAHDILTPRVVFDTEEEKTNLSRLSWEIRELCGLSQRLTLSAYRNEVEHYPFQRFRNVAVPKNNEVVSTITGGRLENEAAFGEYNLTCGIDVLHRDWWGDVYNSRTGALLNDQLIPSVEKLNLGAYLELERSFERFSLLAGLRYDYTEHQAEEDLVRSQSVTDANRQEDHLPGGHLSGRYLLTDRWMVFGGIGRNYRTPTGTERYIQGNPTFFGNPKLEPTVNTEGDLGLSYEDHRWQFQAKGFYADLADYIYQEYNTGGYRSYTNIDAHIYGADCSAAVELGYDFSLQGGLAWQRGRKDTYPDNNNDKDLGQLAPLKTRLALRYNNPAPFGYADAELYATAEWTHSADADRIDTDAGEQQLDSWDTLNLRAGYRYRGCTLNIGLDNAFDQHYTVANSYEWDVIGGATADPAIVHEPGRFLYASLSYKW